ANPAPGRALTAEHVITPVVQTTTDGGFTWQTVEGVTTNYAEVFTGLAIGGGAVPNPTRAAATFTFTTPLTNVGGIRIIGQNGGVADGNGFLGVFELVVNAAPLPGNDADGDGMDDAWEMEHGLNPAVNDANGDPDG